MVTYSDPTDASAVRVRPSVRPSVRVRSAFSLSSSSSSSASASPSCNQIARTAAARYVPNAAPSQTRPQAGAFPHLADGGHARTCSLHNHLDKHHIRDTTGTVTAAAVFPSQAATIPTTNSLSLPPSASEIDLTSAGPDGRRGKRKWREREETSQVAVKEEKYRKAKWARGKG